MGARILVIEDHQMVLQLIDSVLTKEGYSVIKSESGDQGLRAFFQSHYDLVILDLMLPQIQGDEVLREIRKESDVPIIIISAKDTDIDKALLLTLGADDYLTKPFSTIELIARVKAVLRRSKVIFENPSQIKEIGSLKVDFDNFEAFRDDKPLYLTLKEFLILKLFLTNPNHVFTKEQIYARVWNEPYLENDNVINVHMRRLREKIEEEPSKPTVIKTIWGIGYKYEE